MYANVAEVATDGSENAEASLRYHKVTSISSR